MRELSPANVWLMDVDNFIQRNALKEVTSTFIYAPSSNLFHPQGFFSEEIFGQINSPQRLTTFAYINLNIEILSPHIFKNVIDLKPFYHEVMQGKIYAIFDEVTSELIPSIRENENAGTGFVFFMKQFPKLVFQKTSSATRNNKIKTIDLSRDTGTAIINKMIVSPAGIRDAKEIGGRISIEEINKKYSSLLRTADSIKTAKENPVIEQFYDGIKYNAQLKAYEIYAYYKNLYEGKKGFGQGQYAHRALVYGTRNVITSSQLLGKTPDDPAYHKYDETIVPVFQAAKAFQPLVIHELKRIFYNQIFTLGSTRVPAIDPKTLKVLYIDVTSAQVTEAMSTKTSEDLISLFQNAHMRNKPVIIKDAENKPYYISLVYDLEDEIYSFTNIDNFKELLLKNEPEKAKMFDMKKVRPLTYVEMIYIATYQATLGKHGTITRYPAIEIGSIYPTKVKVATTVPSRTITFKSQYIPEQEVVMPMYPIVGKSSYLDSCILHPSRTPGLGADYDGKLAFSCVVNF